MERKLRSHQSRKQTEPLSCNKLQNKKQQKIKDYQKEANKIKPEEVNVCS